ncbi:MAG: DnaA N-terminal domain-containing protein, partial [Betaproteobacteria bacterium]
MTPEFWARCCERLLAELPEQQFNTWIRPLDPPAVAALEGVPNGPQWVARLEMPNRFKLDWVRSQYGALLHHIMNEVAQSPVRLVLALAPQRSPGAAGGTHALGFHGGSGTNGLNGEKGLPGTAPSQTPSGFASAAVHPAPSAGNRLNP